MNYEPGGIGEDEQRALPDGTTRGRKKRWIVIAIFVLIALAAAYWFASRHNEDKDATPAFAADTSQIPTVTVIAPGRQVIDHVVSATGSLAARRAMPVGVAGSGGQITRVLVDQGDWVKSGQTLATIDRSVQTQTAASLSAQVKVAQADAKLAQANLDRAQQLVGRGFISKADIDKLTATRDAAVAQVHVAQAQLSETAARNRQLNILAPAAGLVLTRQAEPGQIVGPGSGTLFDIAKDGWMEMRAQVSESDLQGIHVGARAKVTPVGANESFEGQVWQIEPTINAQTRQGVVRIALRYNDALKPGGFATATINAGGTQAPLLPESAVLSDDAGNYVYIVGADNKVVRRDVTTGQVSDEGVAIAKGLTGNEKVVLAAGAFLNAGQKIVPELKKAGTAE